MSEAQGVSVATPAPVQGAGPSESPLTFDEFERRGLAGAFIAADKLRFIVLIAISSFTVWMAIADSQWWRRALMASVVVALVLVERSARRRFRDHGVDLDALRGNIATMIGLQAVMVLCTGAFASPLLPVFLLSAFLAGLLADGWGIRRLVFGLQIPALAMYGVLHWTNAIPTLVPVPFRVDGGPRLTRLLFVGGILVVLLIAASRLGRRLRHEARDHLEQLQSAQRTALSVHRQRADDLTTMTGEIAHELKNPLASVKGLTQLLARNCPPQDMKRTERLGVLAREVTRMQAILEEFLNFSRPVSPLTRSPVDVGVVCSDVVTLHEAMCASLSVTLHTDLQEGLAIDGDERKIGQVLINLLQNALEAAPPGSQVWLRGFSSSEGVVLEVRDSGPGLEAPVEGAVFKPGMTTKPGGNGLGLTIAQAIARQHGGTLTLANHPKGGCVARLTIPLQKEEAE